MTSNLLERGGNEIFLVGKRLSAYAVSRRGASHIKNEKPCQDATGICCEIIDSKQSLIMAVADGHGGSKYDLSEFGAKLAIRAALDQIKPLLGKDISKSELLNWLKGYFPVQVLKTWRDLIREDISKREPELMNSSLNINENLFKRYGTTLLVMLAVPAGLFLCQLGDGDVVIVDMEGNVEKPIPTSDDLLGNETHSLSSKDSPRLWRIITYSINTPVLVIVSSDGLSNCFEEEEYLKFNKSLYRNIRKYGFEETAKNLPNWLDNASQNGSGDDISLACAIVDPRFYGML